MEKQNVIENRPVRSEGIAKPDYIPFLGGRPSRETVISRDDIIDLMIQLNITYNVEDFLAALV